MANLNAIMPWVKAAISSTVRRWRATEIPQTRLKKKKNIAAFVSCQVRRSLINLVKNCPHQLSQRRRAYVTSARSPPLSRDSRVLYSLCTWLLASWSFLYPVENFGGYYSHTLYALALSLAISLHHTFLNQFTVFITPPSSHAAVPLALVV